mgnify:CR=1 FL=1
MIGQLEIEKASKYSSEQLGDEFSLRDFHYQVNNLNCYLIPLTLIDALQTTKGRDCSSAVNLKSVEFCMYGNLLIHKRPYWFDARKENIIMTIEFTGNFPSNVSVV